MTRLDGQHALVTGGGSGIGRAIAAALAGAGARVTIAGRRSEPLLAAAAALQNTQAITCDVTDESAVDRLFASAAETYGPFDIVVANAGGTESAPLAKTTLDQWSRTIAVNLTGSFLTARAAVRTMQPRGAGRIVLIASTAALKGYAYVAPYCAAKHGVIGLARALALETARTGITVNAICPGFTETPMLAASIRNIMTTTKRSEDEARASLTRTNPQGRFIMPDEVAATVLWLASSEARSVTGQAIAISGGET